MDQPTFPDPFCRDRAEAYQYMLYSLKNERLDVILVPAPIPQFQGHKIRVAQSQNPDWYRWAVWYYGTDRIRRTRLSDYLTRLINFDELQASATAIINSIADDLILDADAPYERVEIDAILSIVPEPTDQSDMNKPPF